VKTTHWFSELSVKLEIINNFIELCRGFLNFAKEKSFDGNVTNEGVEFFNGAAVVRTAPDECVLGYVMRLAEIHHHQFGFSHLFDGVAQAFAAQAGIFDAAVRHLINAEGRDVSGDHAADF
jgi:hypothetical protein